MSKVGKKPIIIPDGVEIKIEKKPEGQAVIFKGPKGELSYTVGSEFNMVIEDKQLLITPKVEDLDKNTSAFWGLHRALLSNTLNGVAVGFEKKLELVGVGFKALIQDKKLILNVGFSHPVEIEIPDNIEVKIEKNIISISGINKELVGQIAADIRAVKKPEPYKGKGIKYIDEVVRRKAGKKSATSG